MNDQHPHAGYVGYDNNPTGSFDTDPLFGALPGHQDGSRDLYDTGPAPVQHGDGAYGNGYDSAYPAGQQEPSEQYAPQWDTGAHQQAPYDAYAAQSHPQAAQNYGTTDTWTPDAVIPDVVIPAPAAAQDATGQWDTTGWDHSGQAGQWANGDTGAFPTSTFSTTAFGTGTYDTAGYDTAGYANAAYGTAGYDTTAYDTTTTGTGYAGVGLDTGAYDATAWNVGATPGTTSQEPEQTSYPSYEQAPSEPETASYEPYATHEHAKRDYEAPGYEAPAYETSEFHTSDFRTAGYEAREHSAPGPEVEEPEAPEATEPEAGTEADRPDRVTEVPAARPVGRSGSRSAGGRGRRRTPAKRSALLTVAVPSACVMSVAGIAAASVGGVGGGEEKKDETTSMAAADPGTVKPVEANNELDTQLANLSADAENFADRASRTQERIDLKARQAADKKKRAEEAARREALRPKFVLPVKQHGLSAYYGQAGVNWMSVHTGIDFPVAYGTPVMAATDGTVRTQYNSAYGNMAIVTAADGTETWYCHLSSTKIRSGSVQAGDVIAYAGDSGNSTGAHLHFEVRPGGGAAIDPMQWLRSHGLNPT